MGDIIRMALQLREWFGKESIGYWVDVTVRVARLSNTEAGVLLALAEGRV